MVHVPCRCLHPTAGMLEGLGGGWGPAESTLFYWQGFGDMILLRVDVKTTQAVGDVFLLTRVLCGPVF